MKKLVCDVCGGRLLIRSGGVPKCDSCGMEYSKKAENITENTAESAKGTSEKERLFKNAETCVKLGDFEQAAKISKNITDEFPYDFRGWWAAVISDTKNLSDFYFLFPGNNVFESPEVDNYKAYRHFLSLAPPERAHEKNTEFERRLNEFTNERRNTKLTHGISEKQTALEAMSVQLLQKKAEFDAMLAQRKRMLITAISGTAVLFFLSVLIFSVPEWPWLWILVILPVLTFFAYRLLSIIKDDEYKNRKYHMIKNISLDCERIEYMKKEMYHKQTILTQEDRL
ncbi:MAG: hypothetical protein LBC86_08815 [Oscillospiraceae bacterium]|nr:hypothetical protein [Oscillospiraceae bacterium]